MIKANKMLVVNHALTRSLSSEYDIDTAINMACVELRSSGISTYGPAIVSIKVVVNSSKSELKSHVIFSCRDKPICNYPTEFVYAEHIRVGPCIYARFQGLNQDSFHVHEKISVYAFENDIRLKKENYTVFVSKGEDTSTIDVFVPIEGDLNERV